MAITLNQSRHDRMGWQVSLPGRSKRLPTVAGGLVAIGLLLAACGGGPDVEEPPAPAAAPTPALEEVVRPVPAAVPAEPVAAAPAAQAISDYLAFCVPGEDIDLAGMTWREYGVAVAAVYADAQDIDPPPLLRRFHTASLQAVQLVLTVIAAQPPDDPVDLFALIGVAMLAAGAIDTAATDLPPALRAQLEAAGCWEPSGAEITGS